ncbi:cupin domain-containing protein [Prosthecomicrobium sp. N25]|uniref:cupin domain-containing protein n=1 Tax=Prosthecomicrobium sp. N25 TaxID=3129254 RepID=UPI003077D3EE
MTTPSPAPVLHGGARRLPVRWLNVEAAPMTVSRYLVLPGEAVTLHAHTGKAEYWLIVAGAGVARVGGVDLAVGPGDVVATPPPVPHALHNTGTEPLVFVNFVQPTGDGPISTTELIRSPGP